MFSKNLFAIVVLVAMFALFAESEAGGNGKCIFTLSVLIINIEFMILFLRLWWS